LDSEFSPLSQRDVVPNPRLRDDLPFIYTEPLPEPFIYPPESLIYIEPRPKPELPDLGQIQVAKIQVTGSTVFSPEELKEIVRPYEGRNLTSEQLAEVINQIAQLYSVQGYTTSGVIAKLDQIPPPDGVVQIQVTEGSLEEIRIEGTRRVNPKYIRNRILLNARKPLDTAKLEEQLRLLHINPLFYSVKAKLQNGTRNGQSILTVRVTEANPFEGSINIDSYSPPSIGSEHLGLNLLHRNLTGNGDKIDAFYYHTTTSGKEEFDISYQIPLNIRNGTLQLRANRTRNQITQESLNTFGIDGKSELYELSFRQPLIYTAQEEFALSGGFSYKDGQTFIFNNILQPFSIGADANGVTRTSVFRFGQDYLKRDVQGAWSVRSRFSFGTSLLDATTNPSPIPDSKFFSWLGQIQRFQRLDENHWLLVSFDVQLTPDSLLPSEQFAIGGGQSIRGYRQYARSGDNGFRFSIEDRITLGRFGGGFPTFQLIPFVDLGKVWNNPNNPDPLPKQTFLVSTGLELLWRPIPGVNIRLGYGFPIIDLDDRGTNAQDEGFYFGVNYYF
ncbi:MAG: ShlB/FhaC/HecB family hemolysin secretion/activation protein, partial [Symploca sp. SIO2D2]|nr:ShlB/FhaC/HecB family hemolysin secretion/activation protein [Symploca sp. SIO2D2]